MSEYQQTQYIKNLLNQHLEQLIQLDKQVNGENFLFDEQLINQLYKEESTQINEKETNDLVQQIVQDVQQFQNDIDALIGKLKERQEEKDDKIVLNKLYFQKLEKLEKLKSNNEILRQKINSIKQTE